MVPQAIFFIVVATVFLSSGALHAHLRRREHGSRTTLRLPQCPADINLHFLLSEDTRGREKYVVRVGGREETAPRGERGRNSLP